MALTLPGRADHVGSLLRPARLKSARADFEHGRIDADALRQIEDQCIRQVVARQEAIGLQAVQAFYAAGCRYLQFDDTVWAYLCSEKERQAARDRGDDPAPLPRRYADVINHALKDKPADSNRCASCPRAINGLFWGW